MLNFARTTAACLPLMVALAAVAACGKEAPPAPAATTSAPVAVAQAAKDDADAPTEALAEPAGSAVEAPAAAATPPEPVPEGLPAGSVLLGDRRHRFEQLESSPPEVVFSNAYAVIGGKVAVRLADGASWPLESSAEFRGSIRFTVSGDAIYDLTSREPSRPLSAPDGRSAAPRPGLRAACVPGATEVAVVDLATGKPISIAADSGLNGYGRERRVAGDAGPLLAFFDSIERGLQVFDASTGRLVASGELTPTPADDDAVALTADGANLMWLAFEGGMAVHILALPAPSEATPPLDLARATSRRVSVAGAKGPFPSDDGSRFAILGDGGVTFYDALTGKLVATRALRRGDRVTRRNARMTDPDTLWYASRGLTRVSVSDERGGPELGDHRAPVKDHAFTADGVTSIDGDAVLITWSRDGKPLRRVELAAPGASRVQLAGDGRRVTREFGDETNPSNTRRVELLDATSGAVLDSVDLPSPGKVLKVTAGEGPVLIELGSYEDTIQVWRGGVLGEAKKALGFSLRGQLLASDDASAWVRQTEQRVSHLNAELQPVRRLTLCGKNPKMDTPIALSPSGRSVAAICEDGGLVIASLEVGRGEAPLTEARSQPLVAPKVPALAYVSEDRDIISLAFCGEDAVLVQRPGMLWQIGLDGAVRSQEPLITPSAQLRAPLRCDDTGKFALTTWLDGRSVLVPIASEVPTRSR